MWQQFQAHYIQSIWKRIVILVSPFLLTHTIYYSIQHGTQNQSTKTKLPIHHQPSMKISCFYLILVFFYRNSQWWIHFVAIEPSSIFFLYVIHRIQSLNVYGFSYSILSIALSWIFVLNQFRFFSSLLDEIRLLLAFVNWSCHLTIQLIVSDHKATDNVLSLCNAYILELMTLQINTFCSIFFLVVTCVIEVFFLLHVGLTMNSISFSQKRYICKTMVWICRQTINTWALSENHWWEDI